jgi:hypothetical protein
MAGHLLQPAITIFCFPYQRCTFVKGLAGNNNPVLRYKTKLRVSS